MCSAELADTGLHSNETFSVAERAPDRQHLVDELTVLHLDLIFILGLEQIARYRGTQVVLRGKLADVPILSAISLPDRREGL